MISLDIRPLCHVDNPVLDGLLLVLLRHGHALLHLRPVAIFTMTGTG